MMEGESGATPKPEPRRFPRSLAIVFFGPLVGAFAAFVLFVLLNVGNPPSMDDLAYVIFSMFLITVAIGWLCGLPAAVLSALIWHVAGRRLHGVPRLLAALVIGAGTSMAAALPIIYTVFGSTFINVNGYVVIGGIGAFAMAVTALPPMRPA